MNIITRRFAIGIAAIAFSFTAATSATSQTTKMKTLKANPEKRVIVRGASQFRRLLSNRGGNMQAVIISCRPVSSEWCSGGFLTGCDRNKGVGSSDPEGGYVCTIPDAN